MLVMLAPILETAAQTSSTAGRTFENQYLAMTILPGWNVKSAVNQTFDLQLTQGEYLLTVDPIFGHASGITGGRFSEITSGMPSLEAVAGNVDQPAGGWECSESPSEVKTITEEVSLTDLYTDSSKSGNGCNFPSNGQPVWFGSYFSGSSSDHEYTITLAYETADVNTLPRKGDSELTHIFGDVVGMLKTLRIKPPITISRIDPESAPPGATVTIYGSGFNLVEYVRFNNFSDEVMPKPIVAADGNSLTFQVPTSIQAVSGIPIVLNGIDVNNCPPAPTPRPLLRPSAPNFCGIAIPPATYQVSVVASAISPPFVPLVVTAPEPPSSVSISLVYPNYLVTAADMITVLGRGFTPTANTVKIGSAIVNSLSSADGKTIVFRSPPPSGITLSQGLQIYRMSVSNANGESNSITFNYR